MSQLAPSATTMVIKPQPITQPAAGYVQVCVEAAAFNSRDCKLYDSPALMVGPDVTKFKVGDRVSFFGRANFPDGVKNADRGAFQQYAVADITMATKIPATIDYDTASTSPATGGTAACALYEKLHYEAPWLGKEGAYKGQKIVVLGGSSSVGCYVIQLAVLPGFEVITTSSPTHVVLGRRRRQDSALVRLDSSSSWSSRR
ncbi:hypothetical protein C8R43DRAFT_1203369 [Mycena crocata]|nr:hypothetical protein C8R43DRAFT_1203369 [Mycena crocata]